MRTSFEPAFNIVIIGLECGGRMDGAYHTDPADPGGETKFGIAKRYHPGVDIKNITIEQAEEMAHVYWQAAGCDDLPYPLDIVAFDSAINPQHKGNKEIFDQHPENWTEFLLMRGYRYMLRSKPEAVKGHMSRIFRLYHAIKALKPG